ncbi:hypothetical protein ACNKHP_17395 [Shigella boydii]
MLDMALRRPPWNIASGKGHMDILAALMFNHHMNLAIAFAGLRPQNIGMSRRNFSSTKLADSSSCEIAELA